MTEVAILGAGSWGTAIGVLLAKSGKRVRLWGRVEDGVEEFNQVRENRRFLPGVSLPESIRSTADLAGALSGDVHSVVVAVPSQVVRPVVRQCRDLISRDALIVSLAKGIENTSLMRMSEVIEEELAGITERISVLLGPSHAEEVSRDIPTAVVAAARDRQVAEEVQDLFMGPRFRVYTNPDLVGVEIGATLKNVIALCAGISDGLGFGDNSKAALMTRGLAEIGRLGVAMGASPLTFAGLTGVGDLIVTCTSMHSRNRRAGIQIGQGVALERVLSEMGMVVEGVSATKAAMSLSQRYRVTMPIVEEAYQVLFENKDPRDAVMNLMGRQKTHEMEEVATLAGW